MAMWSRGAALVAVWLMGTAAARAQYLPVSGSTPSMPEPVPIAVAPGGPMTSQHPGPGSGPTPMAGPADSPMSLPSNLPNAWDDRGLNCPACYVFFGAAGLKRQRPGTGAGPVALLDANNSETGLPPDPTSTVAQNFRDLRPNFNWGVRGTIGYHWDDSAVEFIGSYLFQNDSFALTSIPGRLDSFFFNPPVGFEGNNFLWLQADEIRTSLQTTIGSGEVNYHWWLGPGSTFHWFVGVRYLDLQEKLRIFTDDESLSGPVDPNRQAEYSIRTHNRIIAPQVGLEQSLPVLTWLALTYNAKGAWGVNLADVDSLLKRGDGFVGRSGHRSDTIFSHVYEAGAFLDFCVAANMRFRGGYTLMWVADIAESYRQVDFNLANPRGMRNNEDGTVFYHGPVLELQVVF